MTGTEHTTRLKDRQLSLEDCFSLRKMERAWQHYVFAGLRKQELLDLHDYFDFHHNRKARCRQIRTQVLEGRYKPKTPLFVRVEKSRGVCRRLAIPAAEDALVLQTLVESVSRTILATAPSENAFYSRSHVRSLPPELELADSGEYFWFVKWVEFSDKLLAMSRKFPYLMVTDIANFYDNIPFSPLRNLLSSFGRFDEEILDFLFYVLEAFAWRPDYLPLSGQGLPQINFDAPRLLAHAFLFEADRLLKERTDDRFARWMDDMDIAVESIEEGKVILRDLDELLMARGVRLNSGKTEILTTEQAKNYLWPDENSYLSVFERRVERLQVEGRPLEAERRRLQTRFRRFESSRKIGRWDKVYKRYFRQFASLKDSFLESYTPQLLESVPSLRVMAFNYYASLGPSEVRFGHLTSYVKSDHCLDDASMFGVAKVLVAWPVDTRSSLVEQIVQFSIEIARSHANRNTAVLCGIWLHAKYANDAALRRFLIATAETWSQSEFLSRQVASIVPRIRADAGLVKLIREKLIEQGHLSAIDILINLADMRKKPGFGSDVMLYLKHGSSTKSRFPLAKVLILMDVLSSENLREPVRNDLVDFVASGIEDPVYKLRLIGSVYLKA